MQTRSPESHRRLPGSPLVTPRGVAATEFAVILPVAVLIVFGGLNAAHLITLKHNTKLIADGAAVASSQADNNFTDVKKRFENLATDAGIRSLAIQIKNVTPEIIRVEATIPVAPNNPLNSFSPTIRQITAQSFIYRSPP